MEFLRFKNMTIKIIGETDRCVRVEKPLKTFCKDIKQPLYFANEIIKSFETMEQNSLIKKEFSYLTENIISLIEKE